MSRRRAPARLGLAGLLLALLIPLATGRARAQAGDEAAAIPEPVGFVNDRAGVMDEPARARLEAFLDQLKSKTGAEFAVLVVDSTPAPPDEYKVKVFERWKLGQKGEDNGLLMLVALRQRVVRFETGYGLEGTVPDGFQSRVVREIMAGRFRAGDYTGGITEGVLAVSARIGAEKGVKLEWNGSELRYRGRRGGAPTLSGFLLALVVFLVLVFVLPMVLGFADVSVPRSRRGYRGGYWGGGFGGFGGGGFGGGGGGFGGFGGGASGGGGGGGSW